MAGDVKKKVKPLDPSRFRERRPSEKSADGIIKRLTVDLGRKPTAAEVRKALAIADAQSEAVGKTRQ